MLKALMSVRLTMLRHWLTGASRSKKQQSASKSLLFLLLMLYVLFAFYNMFLSYFSAICKPYVDAGLGWLYFALFALTDFALIFIGSVLTTKGQLFEAKDNELLLSMPVPPRYILASRMLTLLLINMIFNLVVAVPAAVAWCRYSTVSAFGAFAYLLIALLLPFFALAFSALFGWVISLLTRRVKKKSLMTTAFSLLFLAIYFYAVAQANTAITALTSHGGTIAEGIRGIRILYWIGAAITEENLRYLLLSVLSLAAPFLATYWLLSATFIRTTTTNHGFAKIKYVEKERNPRSISAALYHKELQRFVSSSAYMVNAGLGVFFLVIAGLALLFMEPTVHNFFASIQGLSRYTAALLTLAICWMSGLTAITPASISIEGHTLWIEKAVPVRTQEILKAKLLLHLSIACLAIAVAEIGVLFVARPSGLELLCCILLPFLYTTLTALVGLVANLKHPYLDWINETQPVKNSIAVMLTLLLMMGVSFAIGIIGYFLQNLLSLPLAMLVLTVLLAVVCRILYRWILTKGVIRFDALPA